MKMQDVFFEYYAIQGEVERTLWEKSIFAFDANVLLNFYRYSPETVSLLEESIKSYGDRVWIPYNAGIEFYDNRIDVINSQIKNYQDNIKLFRNLLEQFGSIRSHPFISISLLQELRNLNDKLTNEFNQAKKSLSLLRDKKDDILIIIESLFDNKIGDPFSIEELTELYNEGEKRFRDLVPPGFLDYRKEGRRKYGDFVIWKQLIEKSIKSKCSIIFVSDDQKEDWVTTHDGKKYYPASELAKEFKSKTGQIYYSYSTSEFLKYSSKFLNKQLSNETFDEIVSVSNSNKDINKYYIRTYRVEFTLHVELDEWPKVNELQKSLSNRGYIFFVKEKSEFKVVYVVDLVFEDLVRRFEYLLMQELEQYDIKLVSLTSYVVDPTDNR